MTAVDRQAAAVRRILEHRATERAARADVAQAVREALAAGVSGDTIASELLRDSAAHRELGGVGLLELPQPFYVQDERAPLPSWP